MFSHTLLHLTLIAALSACVCVGVCVCVLVVQSCPILCNPMNWSLLGSSVHAISQARIVEWFAISFSRESSRPRDQTWVSCIAGRFFTIWATRESLAAIWEGPILYPPFSYEETELSENKQVAQKWRTKSAFRAIINCYWAQKWATIITHMG